MLLFHSVTASSYLLKCLLQDILKLICCVELTKEKFISVKENKGS